MSLDLSPYSNFQHPPPHPPSIPSSKDDVASVPETPSDAYPDGGKAAWAVVAGSWCCVFVSVGWVACIGDFQSYYQANQLKAYSPSAIGWIPSTQTFLLFALSPVCGHVFDGYGPRPLLVAGTFFHIAGLVLLSFGTRYYQIFLAQSIFSAAGASAIFWAGGLAVCTWFRRRRGFAMGLAASGSAVGGVVGTFVCQYQDPCVLVFSLAGLFLLLGLYLPYDFLALDALDSGMRQGRTTYLLVVLNTTGIVGRILPAWLCDRVGRFNVVILCTVAAALLVCGLWLPATGDTARYTFAALYGVPSAALLSLLPTLASQVVPDVGRLGAHTGAVFLFMSPGFLFTLPIGGSLLGDTESAAQMRSAPMKIFCGLAMAVGGAGFVVARALYVRARQRAAGGVDHPVRYVTVRMFLT
ncbi:hypothetical protein SBRCBS47491_009844 [Sporothrix bragantina]|uniref:Uncharacterized protein n=1 Tax=Sporothrix bragantina TaxID=671064 RepID=A0ABP0CZQ5_9PEZI